MGYVVLETVGLQGKGPELHLIKRNITVESPLSYRVVLLGPEDPVRPTSPLGRHYPHNETHIERPLKRIPLYLTLVEFLPTTVRL